MLKFKHFRLFPSEKYSFIVKESGEKTKKETKICRNITEIGKLQEVFSIRFFNGYYSFYSYTKVIKYPSLERNSASK